MWIVRIALDRPYTFIVLALLLLIIGPLAILRTPTDIFPNIDIPVVSVVWNYNGLPADDMGNRITGYFERALTTTVNDIEHIESQSLTGVSVTKIFFQPRVKVDMAVAQVTAIGQTFLKFLPPGTTPPLVIVYNASSVPILQLALSSPNMSESQLFDAGNIGIRTQLATVQGMAIPFPYGGKQRQVQIDIDNGRLSANGLAPLDVVNAVSAQNLILPAGTEKIGSLEYNIKLNASPTTVEELNDLPIKTVNGATIHISDVAHVRDGNPPQTNIVRVDGARAVLMTLLKVGSSSTLEIIDRVRGLLPQVKANLPEDLNVRPIGDQSLFVRAAIDGVIREGVIAACLTGLMILLFLGSWRSTAIITISIPLSVLVSIITLAALGETINIMTLGGLALAVGILVDDATVAIENINWHLEQGKDVRSAILDGAQQIAIPALVSTLAICIVFVPIFFLAGVARYLFVPLAEAVVFAMLASYVLSRTLIPTLAMYWLKPHGHDAPARHVFARMQQSFERGFERMRAGYHGVLEGVVKARGVFTIAFFTVCLLSLGLSPWLGQDFFPTVDAGQIKLHLRAHTGTRIEETAQLCDQVETLIRKTIPQNELATIVDVIGLPYSGINLTYNTSGPIGPADADVLISLTRDHEPSEKYISALRGKLADAFPGVSFAFQPADIVSQILNFGLPAPIDVQVVGNNLEGNRAFAAKLMEKLKVIPGIADLHLQQAFDQPELRVNVDRTKASQLGFTQSSVASNLLTALTGSAQTTPNFWLDPKNNVSYVIAAQSPQYQFDSLQSLQSLPLPAPGPGQGSQLLSSVASFSRGTGQAVVSHYNVQPTLDLFASVQGIDLGSVASEVERITDASRKDLPRGSQLIVRGQIATMFASYKGLFGGLAFAILLVYLLIVINFQSWLDPFIIVAALPAALAGIVWMLFVTHTPLSVPALMGSIMCMGVATANSILVVSFARERMDEHFDPVTAAIEAGFSRFRPVLMTALAMIIGMLPMALGLGEGGEQNAPLGRAVIGGLSIATLATLFFVPTFFALLHRAPQPRQSALPEPV